MALPLCIEIPDLNASALTLPGGITIEQINLMEAIQPALTPLVPLFDIIDTVVAVFNCIKAIPDALGPPPDPTILAACLPELGEKIAKLLRLVPPLSLPVLVAGLLDLVIKTLREARHQLAHMKTQLEQIARAVDRAKDLDDAGLLAITNCAKANVAQEAANVGRALASLGKLMGLINLFMGMFGGPEVPDLSGVGGQPLDPAIDAIDVLITTLAAIRQGLPL
jgi:hypothetical protein